MTPREIKKLDRINAMYASAKTIVDFYRYELAAAENRSKRIAVWRTYKFAVITEQQRRAIGGVGVKFRRARGDAEMPRPFPPYWAALGDDILTELDEILEAKRPR